MNTSPRTHFKSPSPVQISAIVVGNIIFWMLMLAAIGLGATHLNSCPVQPNIPVYLMVLGAASLVALSVTYTLKNGDGCALISFCSTFVYLFAFCWLIAGSVWVYPLYPPSYTPGGQYCHRTTYQFAFVVTTVMWASLFIFVFSIGLLISCKIEFTRSRLVPSRYAFYGATRQGPAAGDV
ncbi:transmembrane protein 272-like [Brachionichthys hirsutus]|uniref:transmembrane protein 272-like n=1 Tax=Brachionichthys hirsutus TaxID=412623 RepID=UPI00360525B4